jgi:hypothetical protein
VGRAAGAVVELAANSAAATGLRAWFASQTKVTCMARLARCGWGAVAGVGQANARSSP